MKIAVVGAGAMGSLYGGLLSKNNEVFLVDIWKEHVNTINNSGLIITEPEGDVLVRPKAVASAELVGTADLVILFTKCTNTKSALDESKSLIGPDTILLSLQNGYGNAEDMADYADADRILVGTTGHGCSIKEPGHIIHAGKGETHIGAVSEDQARAFDIARVLMDAGFETHISSNIMELVWKKLFVNIGINPITALLSLPNKAIAENPAAQKASMLAVREAVAAANAGGMNFDETAVWKNVIAVAENTGENTSSMLADVLKCRQTEIVKINGAVVKKAAELGVPAPVNEMLTLLIQAKENSYLQAEQ